jgi:hypothetical protein
MAATLGELVIDQKRYSLDDLTLGELEALEDHMTLPLSQVDLNSARAMKFLVYLVKHREDPNYTLDNAGEVKIVDLLQEDPASPPADAGAEADAPASEQTEG